MYKKGDIPNDYKVNNIVNILDKVGTEKCEKYRTISLTVNASKILSTIIFIKLEQTIESSLNEDQFGFREEKGSSITLIMIDT